VVSEEKGIVYEPVAWIAWYSLSFLTRLLEEYEWTKYLLDFNGADHRQTGCSLIRILEDTMEHLE